MRLHDASVTIGWNTWILMLWDCLEGNELTETGEWPAWLPFIRGAGDVVVMKTEVDFVRLDA